MQLWEAVVLGVVQGVTEFLPISSTGHLLVVRTWMGHTHPEDAFTTVIQIGTSLAVFWYFRADVLRLVKALGDDIRAFRPGSTPDARQGWLIVLGTIPAVLVGLSLKSWLKQEFFNVRSVAKIGIIFGVVMALAEYWKDRRSRRGLREKQESDIGWKDALFIGCFQCLALMPGGSRSGTTITAGLFAGLSRPAAARFSFLLSLPIVLGAGLKELYDEYKQYRHPDLAEPPSLFASGDDVTNLVVGTVVSAVVGYFAIAWLLGFLKRYSTYAFVVYRIVLGILILALVSR
ncbi:MAG TPA: undecaprenyl-diphosphatase UppP [Fimbriiglobus sp.]|jgi:undecaprenyl-diphosphatase